MWDLWQVHYEILLIISWKEFKNLNVKIKYFSEYESANNNLINHKCLSCHKNYSKKIDENLKNPFKNTFRFSDDINKFILLRKGIYSHEFMDSWEKFSKTLLPVK